MMEWTKEIIHDLVEEQRKFFKTGTTLSIKWRITQLKKLREAMVRHTPQIEEALHLDLGRTSAEAYFCDIGSVISEINETIHGLRKWAKPETHFSGLVCFPSTITKVYKLPYGVSLIVSPFNFPFLLSAGVLLAAIAGGNTAVVKCSSKTPHCTQALMDLCDEIFPHNFVRVVDGGHDVADWCLEERFDKIFYTGSPNVGKHVLACASVNLTPCALELGGETGNWAIVRKGANLRDAARKIAFFKICNSGQICINVNQVAVAEEVKDEFVECLKAEFIRQIGEDALANEEYPRLVGKKAYTACADEAELYRDRIVLGGKGNPDTFQYQPTIIYPATVDDPICNHETFAPLLPVVPFKDAEIDQLLSVIADREHGLSLYLFTKDIKWAKKVMASQQYGMGCINEVIMQSLVHGVPFNGTGHSGMGAYHGIWGFREFTHPSTCLIGKTHFNLPLREHPYNGKKNAYKKAILKKFLG